MTNGMWRGGVMVAILASALLVGGVISFFASESPDGLERTLDDHQVAAESAELQQAPQSSESASPLSDYSVAGVENRFLSNAVAGTVGTLATLGLVLALGRVIRRRPRSI